MIEKTNFKTWLQENTNLSLAVIGDTVSRANRADGFLAWNNEDTYLFFLEKSPEFQKLSVSCKSQLRRAMKYYATFVESQQKNDNDIHL